MCAYAIAMHAVYNNDYLHNNFSNVLMLYNALKGDSLGTGFDAAKNNTV